jgi:hypothetical protein
MVIVKVTKGFPGIISFHPPNSVGEVLFSPHFTNKRNWMVRTLLKVTEPGLKSRGSESKAPAFNHHRLYPLLLL